MKVHIGKKIKEAVKRSGISVTEFAEKINYSRRNIYSIFEKESIDTALLSKINQVLEHNFFIYFPDVKETKNLRNERKTEYTSLTAPSGDTGYYETLKKNYENKIKELLKEVEYLKEINGLLKMQEEKLAKKNSRKN